MSSLIKAELADENGKYTFVKRKWWQFWKPRYKKIYILTLVQMAKAEMTDPSDLNRSIKKILERNNSLLDEMEFSEANCATRFQPGEKFTRIKMPNG